MGTFEIIVILLLGVIVGLFLHLSKKISESKNNGSDIEKYEKIQDVLNSVLDRGTEAQKELFNQKTDDLVKAVNSQSKDLSQSLNTMTSNIESLDKVTDGMKLEINEFSKVLGADSSLTGRFGQWQLKNLFNYHNLKENVDYMIEVSAKTRDGKQYRPDAILISDEKCLVIDSKMIQIALDITSLLGSFCFGVIWECAETPLHPVHACFGFAQLSGSPWHTHTQTLQSSSQN